MEREIQIHQLSHLSSSLKIQKSQKYPNHSLSNSLSEGTVDSLKKQQSRQAYGEYQR